MKAAGARLGNPHNLIMPARLVEGAGSRGGRLFDRECRHRGSANIAQTSFKNAGLRSEGTRIVQTTT
jgi:hypothetical protein